MLVPDGLSLSTCQYLSSFPLSASWSGVVLLGSSFLLIVRHLVSGKLPQSFILMIFSLTDLAGASYAGQATTFA